MYDTIITGGDVVAGGRIRRADIGIRDGKIAAVRAGIARAEKVAKAVIRADGRYVIPGGVDVHVHLDLRAGGTVTADDFETGTRMAACGGVTTIVDFVTPRRDQTLRAALGERLSQAEGKACVDYALHMSLTNLTRQAREIPRIIEAGLPTFKQYTVYEGLRAGDADIYRALEIMRDAGGMLLLHAESPDVLAALIVRHHRRHEMKEHGAMLHAITRPNVIEAEAVDRALHWVRATGGALYFVHLSTAEAVDSVARAQEEGLPVHAETCVHYLVFDERVFGRADGHLFATCPQVKKPRDRARLWSGLRDGTLRCISTDTCSFTRAQKDTWRGDFTRIPMGMPGLEMLLPAVYTHGVLQDRLTVLEFVDLCCTMPAKTMGLYPQKGTIRVGSDADLVVFHPSRRRRVDWRKMHSRCDWHPFQGRALAGFAEHVLSRGRPIVSDSEFVGDAGHGQFVPRSLA